ncbi:oxoglutarate-dependent flavonoid 7-O-demethylase 1-like [Lotus japonicus]|uniref:oxoglutarate-dependent flavonoid 7-O-demethylase 1-like n=1 Tax=Lotus japonicus TaxID=34305 RepID=UPI00258F0A9C|nr:oxoglutarate-dependent flavonoid 7-O-demethylase 1-like [Lotus japonicus]
MDREMVTKLGTSLAVPSVQELAKQPITKVPEQYVRPNQEPPVISNTISLSQVPVIDFNKLLSDDGTELEKLDHACKEWGFFQLINHGVNSSLVEDMKMDVQKFFNLSVEEKKVFSQKPGEMEGLGQMFIASEETKLEWADLLLIVTLPPNIRNPHLFPNLPQPFRDNLERYALELKNLYVTILEFMTKALKIQPSEVPELFEEGSQAMRMNYYPPCPQPEKVIGLNSHSDNSILTLLLQVNENVGLEIRKDGMWIPIKPLLNAFVINVGDVLEIMTNGIYRSIEHRATVNAKKERISIATFQSPRLNAFIGPAPSLVTPERPAMFNRISVEDFYKGYFSEMLQGKSHINVLRIQNE